MKGILFVAHGSRRKESNLEFETMVRDLHERLDDTFSQVKTAFLEFAEPGIEEAIDAMIRQGITTIKVYPFFLNSGRHVHHDIPETIERAKESHPDVDFKLLPHFGSSSHILSVITQDIKEL